MIPRPQRSVTSIAGFGHSASFESQLLEAAEDEAEAGLAAAASVDSVLRQWRLLCCGSGKRQGRGNVDRVDYDHMAWIFYGDYFGGW